MTQNMLTGITRIIAGSISAMGNILTLIIRKPVASIRKPPQALKSLIMEGVVWGMITPPSENRMKKRINCGMAMAETTSPSVQAKIRAVKRSRIDFEKRML